MSGPNHTALSESTLEDVFYKGVYGDRRNRGPEIIGYHVSSAVKCQDSYFYLVRTGFHGPYRLHQPLQRPTTPSSTFNIVFANLNFP